MGNMRRQELKVHLDSELRDWVRQEAKRRHCSLSQVIRDLIVEKMASKK